MIIKTDRLLQELTEERYAAVARPEEPVNDPCRGDHDGMGDGREPDGTAEWWSGVSTTDEHVAHMVAALRSARPTPGVDRILLKDAAAMLFVLHRELRQWREAHERSPAEGADAFGQKAAQLQDRADVAEIKNRIDRAAVKYWCEQLDALWAEVDRLRAVVSVARWIQADLKANEGRVSIEREADLDDALIDLDVGAASRVETERAG